jgi:hypothetical protein
MDIGNVSNPQLVTFIVNDGPKSIKRRRATGVCSSRMTPASHMVEVHIYCDLGCRNKIGTVRYAHLHDRRRTECVSLEDDPPPYGPGEAGVTDAGQGDGIYRLASGVWALNVGRMLEARHWNHDGESTDPDRCRVENCRCGFSDAENAPVHVHLEAQAASGFSVTRNSFGCLSIVHKYADWLYRFTGSCE